MATETKGAAQQPPLQNQLNDPVETFILKDGRTLAYANYGEPLISAELPPVFYFNGTPGVHLEARLIDAQASSFGIPIIATDRPGFGESSWQENRTLISWPKDITELADHLNISKFAVMGLSGGGPHALACLHEIPRERLVAATVVSGMYPLALGTTGMMWQTRSLFWLASYSTWAVEKMLDLSMGKALRDADTQTLITQMESQAKSLPQPEADKECMKQILHDDVLFGAYIGSMKEALSFGCRGAAWEFWLFASDWGFKLEDLDASRLTVWHGEFDVNVPVGMPDKVFELLPKMKYIRMESEGHISLIVRHRQEILGSLMESMKT